MARAICEVMARAICEVQKQRDGNPQQSENPIFCECKKLTVKRKNPDGQIKFAKVRICFSPGFSRFLQKNGSPGGDRTHDQLLRRQLLYPLGYRAIIWCLLYNMPS